MGSVALVVALLPGACRVNGVSGASGHCPSRCRWDQCCQWSLSFQIQVDLEGLVGSVAAGATGDG